MTNARTGQRISALANAAIAAIVSYVLLVGALHFLRPDLNPVVHYESEYGNGPYSLLMTIAFLLRAALTAAIIVGLYLGLSSNSRSMPGLVLLGVYSIGAVLLAIFPANIAGAQGTVRGAVHNIVALAAFICVTIAPFQLAGGFKKDADWAGFARTTLRIGVCMLAMLIAFVVAQTVEESARQGLPHIGGLAERIFIVFTLAWLLLIAFQLRSLALSGRSPNVVARNPG